MPGWLSDTAWAGITGIVTIIIGVLTVITLLLAYIQLRQAVQELREANSVDWRLTSLPYLARPSTLRFGWQGLKNRLRTLTSRSDMSKTARIALENIGRGSAQAIQVKFDGDQGYALPRHRWYTIEQGRIGRVAPPFGILIVELIWSPTAPPSGNLVITCQSRAGYPAHHTLRVTCVHKPGRSRLSVGPPVRIHPVSGWRRLEGRLRHIVPGRLRHIRTVA